jgi:RHS repeat-associated protein
MMTDGTTGAPVAFHDYLAFGEEIQAGIGGRSALYDLADPKQKFTGKERDSETGLDYFGARYLSSAQGRWTIPDWSGKTEPVPYAKLGDTQTLNLYVYVRNNPLGVADPDGHCPADNPNCQDLKPNPATVTVEVKQAINNSVAASNKPTADDPKGKSHEEGGVAGKDANGNQLVVPADPGKFKDVNSPGNVSIDPLKAADPSQQGKVQVPPDVMWHVHPAADNTTISTNPGTGVTTSTEHSFAQAPSPGDIRNAVGKLNLVVGARDKTVYVYNTSGSVCQESLKDFNKQNQ